MAELTQLVRRGRDQPMDDVHRKDPSVHQQRQGGDGEEGEVDDEGPAVGSVGGCAGVHGGSVLKWKCGYES